MSSPAAQPLSLPRSPTSHGNNNMPSRSDAKIIAFATLLFGGFITAVSIAIGAPIGDYYGKAMEGFYIGAGVGAGITLTGGVAAYVFMRLREEN